jgi:hypothetical protein
MRAGRDGVHVRWPQQGCMHNLRLSGLTDVRVAFVTTRLFQVAHEMISDVALTGGGRC